MDPILDSGDSALYQVTTRTTGPEGSLPLTDEMLREWPSGDLFGLSQNVGMGWDPNDAAGTPYLLLSTQGGMRGAGGAPEALGLHTGHWEVGLLVAEAARTVRAEGGIPFAAACTDPCDGRTQGTAGMLDSLPFRNDAAAVFARLIRSLPRRAGVLGAATCDKGLPAMMMALAGARDLPVILVPGGVTLPAEGSEDAGRVQSIGARFAQGEITLKEAAEAGCRACASPGGGCQFLGTAATSQVVAEALGLSLPHTALAPSGQPIWRDAAGRSARALIRLVDRGITSRDLLTPAALQNAMAVFAAFGGSTNLLIHLPAIAHAAGLDRPGLDDWIALHRRVPRLVDALPNGPRGHATIQVFLAGGVPEVMLHLRELDLLELDALTVSGQALGSLLDWWEHSPRRQALRERLRDSDGVDPDDVIRPPDRGLAPTMCFPRGSLAPGGSVVKSTAIDPELLDGAGVYVHEGPARVFHRERDAIAAIKEGRISAGDVLILAGRGPRGAGMEEVYQVTAALRWLSWGRNVPVLTDARFSGVTTGACVGHITPEALAGGPLGRLRDGDRILVEIDTRRLEGRLELQDDPHALTERDPHPDLSPDPELPPETRLWAILQEASGGPWAGALYDAERISEALKGSTPENA